MKETVLLLGGRGEQGEQEGKSDKVTRKRSCLSLGLELNLAIKIFEQQTK